MTTGHDLQEELLAALALTESDGGVLRAPYFGAGRGVVFGGQLLGQAIVAAGLARVVWCCSTSQNLTLSAGRSPCPTWHRPIPPTRSRTR